MITRRSFVVAAAAGAAMLLGGCGSGGGASSSASSAAGASSSASSSAAASNVKITVGTLATEDILPYWVATDQGLFAEEGLDVDIVEFQSATEPIAGVASGEVDLAMTDIMVSASMVASGVGIKLKWVTLGATADQGRFGIMVGPDSNVQSLSELAGVPIGVGSNTILEYVMDNLMEAAGVPDDQIVVEEIQKLPVRYQAMASGEVAAAALPGSLLALGEASGCRTIADDSTGENLSTSVMVAQVAVDADTIASLEKVWDQAVALINADPEAYRATLVANANLSEAVAGTYPISEYPEAELPTEAMVVPVLDWMEGKGYLTQPLTYSDLV